MLKGIGASPGIAIGKVYLKSEENLVTNEERITEEQVTYELDRLHEAINQARQELTKLKEKTAEKIGKEKAEIFQAHLMFLDDPELIPQIESKIKKEKFNAVAAVYDVVNEYAAIFAAMENEYMKGREADIKDVGNRLIKILSGKKREENNLHEKAIIVARDLTPSDTAQFDSSKVLAFVTGEGSRTSHTAIMARSLGIPAVVGVGENIMNSVDEGDLIVVDGNKGKVFISPDDNTLGIYKEKLVEFEMEKERLAKFKNKKAVTGDGKEVEIAGNIGTLKDLDAVLRQGGEGIGLFRTEFLYMDRKELPDEEEQFQVYKEVAEKMEGKPVVIRTLDIGGDKELPYLKFPEEMNPFLGYRAIRMCLDRKDIFKPQLRALLRASSFGNIKIMYPMVTNIEEVKKANDILNEVKEELKQEGRDFNNNIEVGVMIETPAAVMISDILAREVDFFSIGTNDLIQYTIAVDRTNDKISELHTPYHPSILRLIKKTIETGHQAGIWVGMCGEAAGDELLLPFLLGAGLDEFSMSAVSILRIKELLSKWTIKEAEEVVEKVLDASANSEVKEILEKYRK